MKLGREDLRTLIETKMYNVPVVIRGTLVSVWSLDDGVSREFQVHVEGVTLGRLARRRIRGRVA